MRHPFNSLQCHRGHKFYDLLYDQQCLFDCFCLAYNGSMTTQTTQTQINTTKDKALDWLTVFGVMMIIGIMISGVLIYTNDDDNIVRNGLYWAIYALMGGLYLVGFLRWDNFNDDKQNFFALTILTTLGLVVMVMVDFHGLIWFLLMPTTMQSSFFLSRRNMIIYTIGLVLFLNIFAYAIDRNPQNFLFSLWVTNTVTIGTMYGVGIVIQIALVEQLQAREEVEKLNAQLREYANQSAHLAKAQERNRIARMIHDSVGHSLTVVSVQLEAAEKLIQLGQVDKASTAIHHARQVTKDGLDEVRASVRTLQSDETIDQFRLSDALDALVERTRGETRQVILTSSPDVQHHLDTLSPSVQVTLLHAMQEGMTNALKHAIPTLITLNVDCVDERLRLTLMNNAPKSIAGEGTRTGLIGLETQLQAIGGTVSTNITLTSFTLMVEIPYVRS